MVRSKSSQAAATVHGLPTVFWQIGPVAYALNGDLAEADLMALAQAATPRPLQRRLRTSQ